ncbi:Aureobasidin resistance protein Aur1 [Tulasnella sp. JGI-2019a]|nr:Aureobasidin resistance protein Aur1 [Tulasnella sp. JGI-2019a]
MSVRVLVRNIRLLLLTIQNSVLSLNTSFDPSITLAKFRSHKWTTIRVVEYTFDVLLVSFWMIVCISFPYNLGLAAIWVLALLLPISSQFIAPATPVLVWVITYFTSKFLPISYRPGISVSVLPTLESVLYGANISDILTRWTHPVLDIVAWLPYGVLHFIVPFVVAIFLWLFRQKAALKYWSIAFGYMNLTGVIIQILFPCAAPWYEVIYGLTPAHYGMPGSAGGLARIDALFHSHGYTGTFSNSPVIFGAFPSLHSGCSTMEALFISHFFPQHTFKIWCYTLTLYWATMYLTHHYLIDVVAGACLSIVFFYVLMPREVKEDGARERSGPFIAARQALGIGGIRGSKYEQYDLDRRANRERMSGNRAVMSSADSASSSRSSLDVAPLPLGSIRSPNPDGGAAAPGGVPLANFAQNSSAAKSHRHTASIASLIHADDRVEEGWSPVVGEFSTSVR